MGGGIGGPVVRIMTGNAFEMLVSHVRRDNKDEYGRKERIMIDCYLTQYLHLP